LADAARQWYAEMGRPWICAHETGFELLSEKLSINGADFASEQLNNLLLEAQAHRVVLVAVSAGRECEEHAHRLWREGKPDEYFFLEVFGSAVVEHLITIAGARICAWADQHGMAALPHYSPGYSGWDVSDQTKLFQAIRGQQMPDFPGDLQVLASGMLQPKKSLLAVFGITGHVEKVQRFANLVPCHNCSFPSCQYRRAPYKDSLPQSEDVRRLQSGWRELSAVNTGNGSPLNHHANYSINLRALRKWSQQRLRFKILPDLAVEARFRYEGTTCSNLGRPLEYDYRIKLSSAEEGYRIIEANCSPAPGDTGHTQMCEYLNDRERLLRSIQEEKPLLGSPLNDVVAWERPYSPAGCYCDMQSREHKWGLVFEVIHYALVQHEKSKIENGAAKALSHSSG